MIRAIRALVLAVGLLSLAGAASGGTAAPEGAATTSVPGSPAAVAPEARAAAAAAPYSGTAPFTWKYSDAIAPVVTDLIERSAALSRPVYDELELAPVKGVVVHVARDHAEFLRSAPPGLSFPPWAEGITIPPRGEIFLTLLSARGGPVDVERVFAHEVSHVAVHVASGGNPVPRWFVEGFAILQSGEFSMDQVETMAQLVARGGVSLRSMDRAFHGHAPSASAAYGAAADFVHFYKDECGRPALARVVKAVSAGADFYDAMGFECHGGAAKELRPGAAPGATVETFDALEQRWMSGLSDRYPWFAMLRDDGALWVAAALMLILGFLLVRRRRREQLRRMESQEQHFDAVSDRAVAAAEERERRAANALLRRQRGLREPPSVPGATGPSSPSAAPAPGTPSHPTDDDVPPPGGWVH